MSNRETRILLVDDDAALRDLLKAFFDERGVSVTFREDVRDLNQVVLRERALRTRPEGGRRLPPACRGTGPDTLKPRGKRVHVRCAAALHCDVTP
ncbi:hypothetical protein SBC1_44970 (plasmid) [Caballeronia sp. SBC1]|nr:hypothetical protein SBC2_43000 [Caballeronia sp. SBC2]QIN64457.1 hypothetical protein SBC1_44970 [Caballeronia sp. SBC1]